MGRVKRREKGYVLILKNLLLKQKHGDAPLYGDAYLYSSTQDRLLSRQTDVCEFKIIQVYIVNASKIMSQKKKS